MSAFYNTCVEEQNDNSMPLPCKYIWSDDSSERFQAALSSVDIQEMIHNFEFRDIPNCTDSINNAAVQLSNIFITAADKSLRKTKKSNKKRNRQQNNLFDADFFLNETQSYILIIRYSSVYSNFPTDTYVRNHFYKMNREYTKARKARKKVIKNIFLVNLKGYMIITQNYIGNS